ncbi:MAG TPA: TadE/TadG family type IV pilus assembly protein [Gemmatimonadaceae bacterium]
MKTPRARCVTRFARDERGAALVEFAIIATVLMILMFGIIDFGRALYTKNSLTNAAREGGRYAAVLLNPAANMAAIQDTVIAHMSPLGGATLTRDEIDVVFNEVAGKLQSVTTTINYPFEPITPIAGLVGLDPLTLRASAQFRWELGGST